MDMREKLEQVMENNKVNFTRVNVPDPDVDTHCTLASGWEEIDQITTEAMNVTGLYDRILPYLEEQHAGVTYTLFGEPVAEPVKLVHRIRPSRGFGSNGPKYAPEWNDEEWEIIELIEELVEEYYGEYFVFTDEYDTCVECGKLVRTAPDSYGWTPGFVRDWYGLVYHVKCIEPECVLEWQQAQPNGDRLRTLPRGFVPEEQGLKMIEIDYEHGLHHGQDDDPHAIVRFLNEAGIPCWFTVRPGQFDVSFNVWVLEEDFKQALRILSTGDTKLPYSPAESMKEALKQALKAVMTLERHRYRH